MKYYPYICFDDMIIDNWYNELKYNTMNDICTLDTDEYMEILNGIETLTMNPARGVSLGGMMLGDGMQMVVYIKRLEMGLPTFMDFDFIKRFWSVMTSVQVRLKSRIESFDGELKVDKEELAMCEGYFMDEEHREQSDVVALNNGLMMNLDVLKDFYVHMLMRMDGVLRGQVLAMDRRQKDQCEMYGLLNECYEKYRDVVWRNKRQEMAKKVKMCDDSKQYLKELYCKMEDRLNENFFKEIHGECCDEDGQGCDYWEFARLIFIRGNRGWEVKNLEEYFDIVLTMDYVEAMLKGKSKYMKHPLSNVLMNMKEQRAREESDETEEMVKTMEWAFKSIEEFLMEKYTVKRMMAVVHNLLTNDPINDKHKRAQVQFRDFLKNASSTRPGEFKDGVSVQSMLRLFGMLCGTGIIKSVKPMKVIEKVLTDECEGKMESYRTYYYKGKNELSKMKDVLWKEWLLGAV